MGVTDFGIGAHGKPYAYQTKEFLGVANITSLSTYNASLPAGSRHWMSFQMNVVQAFVYFGTTYVYWIQDVAKVNTSTNYFSFIDNVWNLSSTAANVYASTLSGNGSVASSSGRGYYFDYASSLPGNNVSLTYPATVEFAVVSSTSSHGPEVAFMYNDGSGWQTYDNVYFVFAPNPALNSGFVVDGYQYTPSYNFYDAELIMGGSSGGQSTNDTSSQVELQLKFWNGNNFQLTPSAYNFGGDTAETIGHVISSEYYYPVSGVLFTYTTVASGTLAQIYNQSRVSFLNVKSSFTFQGNVSGTLDVGGTSYSFVGGDINLTLAAGTYNLQLYSAGGVLYWSDNGVTLSPGQVLQLNAGYSATFLESGLPSGQSWSIMMSNESGASATLSSTSTHVTFVVPMGYYGYMVNVVNGYSPTMINNYGNISQNTIQDVTFMKWPTTMISTGSGSSPQFALYDPSNGYVYVSNNNAGSICVFNGSSVVQVISTGAGNRPGEMVYDPSNGHIYVLFGQGIGIVNTSSGTVSNILPGYYFSAMTYDSSNAYLYATGGKNITVINPATDLRVQSIALNFYPSGIAYDANDNYLYLTNMKINALGGNITILNPQTSGIVAVIAVNYEPLWISYDAFNNEIYANGFNYNLNAVGMNTYSVPGNVSVISGTSILKTMTVGYVPGIMAFNPSNGQIYLSNLFSDNVTIIDSSTNTVMRSIAVGYYPIGVAYNPETGVLYVADVFSGNVALVSVTQIYSIMFSETGLPSGTSWSVTLNGVTESSASSTITFNEPNGTYAYGIATTNKSWSSGGGSFTVSGSSMSKSIIFTEVTYTVTLTEAGLPSGTSWSVTLNGKTSSFSTSSAAFALQNGTYTFEIGNVSGYTASQLSVTVTVNGTGVTRGVSYSIIDGYLTGSVNPTSATVSVNGKVVALVNGQFNVTLGPGTYEVTATYHGYNNYYGNITVTGGQSTHLAISMTRSPQSSPSHLLSGSMLYIGAGIAVIAVVGAVAFIALSRRKKHQ